MGEFIGGAVVLGAVIAPLLRRAIDTLGGTPPGRYTAIIVTALVCGIAALSTYHDPVAPLVVVPLASAGIVMAYVDLSCRILPDIVVLPAYPAVGVVLIVGAGVTANPEGLLRAAAAATACLLGYAAVAASGGLGFGDVKLAGLVGLVTGWIGWETAIAAVILAAAMGSVVAALAWTVHGRRATIAFGPPMMLGALTAAGLVGAG